MNQHVDTPWCKSIPKMSTGNEGLIADRMSGSSATLAKRACHNSFVCVSQQNMVLLKDRRDHVCMRVCDSQSLPQKKAVPTD